MLQKITVPRPEYLAKDIVESYLMKTHSPKIITKKELRKNVFTEINNAIHRSRTIEKGTKTPIKDLVGEVLTEKGYTDRVGVYEREMHPILVKCADLYETAYNLSMRYNLSSVDAQEIVEPEYRDAVIAVSKFYQETLPALTNLSAHPDDKNITMENMIINNNERIAGDWAEQLGLDLPKLKDPR